ncbi:recombinase family protein [Paenibacillus taichungensis]|uniref:recombinase family protein n=1 Tax=Paenibacillus taichungensis TaxID=484184 RepID=UPI0039A1B99C
MSALIGKIRAIVYVRVSSEIQVDNYSLGSQIEICVKEAKDKFNITEDEIIVLREEAESGDNPNRPMLNYIVFLLSKGIGSKVIFLHPDRLSRHLHLQQQITHKIWELGCDIHFVEFDLDRNNAESMLNFNIQGSIAQYNKAKILANTKRGRRAMVANNKIPGMNRLYGYTYDKELQTLVENPKEKEGYLTMVKMILSGETCSGIARHLSINNYCAPKGDKWYEATISRILNNETYKGVYYYGKTEVKQINGEKVQVPRPRDEWKAITIPAYIDESTYEKVRKCLESNIKQGGRPSEVYLLKGMVRCGRCGAAVSGGVACVTQSGTHRYYTCTQKTRKSFTVGTGESNKVCLGHNWRTDMIDTIIWKEVIQIIESPKHLIEKMLERVSDKDKIDELENRKVVIKKELADKDKSKERYIDLYADGLIKSKDELTGKLQPLENDIERLKHELSAITDNLKITNEQNDDLQMAVSVLEKYQKIIKNDLQIKDKRKILSILVDKIVLHDDKRIEVFYKFTSEDRLNDRVSTKKLLNYHHEQVNGR